MLTVYIYLTFFLGEVNEEAGASLLLGIGMIGSSGSLWILVMFNESWLLNLAFFVPCQGVAMHQAGKWSETDIDIHWLCLIAVFQIFIYGIVGYRVEYLRKMCFIGCES